MNLHADDMLERLAEAFVEVTSIADPFERAVRGQQLFGKAYGFLFGRAHGPVSATTLARAFERAVRHG